MLNFPTARIRGILEDHKSSDSNRIKEILAKARERKGLELVEVAALLLVEDPELIKEMKEVAGDIKAGIYGKRIVLFAPLYASNYCVNNCQYCNFHTDNKDLPRRKLSLEEVAQQTEILEEMGHKRLLLEFGEDARQNSIDYVDEVVETIYATKKNRGEIRRVNVNIAATGVDDYRRLQARGIGTYQLFQETYHYPTYQKIHRGPKADYLRQVLAHERALEAGLDDYGMGVLFGLYDYKFDVLALMAHAQYMEQKFGVGPHTISVPRFCPGETVRMERVYQVSDQDFLKIIAIIRMTLPYTGMIISTRETPEIRSQAFKIGISQTSAGSRTVPGGYAENEVDSGQFELSDHRPVDEVVKSLCQEGYLPSFCTACYREGRTGEDFMDLAKKGVIQNLCQPNAILTFKEYLLDYAGDDLRRIGIKQIEDSIAEIENDKMKKELRVRLRRLEDGTRDLYF